MLCREVTDALVPACGLIDAGLANAGMSNLGGGVRTDDAGSCVLFRLRLISSQLYSNILI